MDVLSALDTWTAASVLARVEPSLRRELLSMVDPGTAANIVQVSGQEGWGGKAKPGFHAGL
jgi:hypothetical protein